MEVEYRIGDALELFEEIDRESINLVLTDPPFGVGYNYDTDKFQDWTNKEEYMDWCHLWFDKIWYVLKPTGIFLCFSSPKYIMDFLCLGEEVGFHYQDTIIWDKKCCQAFNGPRPMPRYEPCYFWTKDEKKWTYNPPCQNVLSYMRNTERTGIKHKASRPVELYKKLIETFSNPNEIVLDPFLGSGTTLLACRMTGRRGLGFEINPEYKNVIESRIHAKIDSLF